MEYCKFHDRPHSQGCTVATVAVVARGAGQISKLESPQIGRGTPATVATVATVVASPSAPKANGKDSADQPRICAQCNAGGPPLHQLEGSDPPVWLHPECRRFWLKDHPTTNGSHKPADQPTPDDGLDMPACLRRCFHCGKSGATPWDWNGRTIHLHPRCERAWADQQARGAFASATA